MSPVTPNIDPDGEMMAFARLIAARHDVIRVIGKDNTARRARWPEQAPGQPFAVHLARGGRFRTVALDFDATSEGPQQAARDAGLAARLLARCGVPAVVVASGPGGGRHVLATVTAPGLPARDARRLVQALRRLPLASLDPSPLLNAATGCVRPPLSPHRLGGTSRILGEHAVARAALSAGAAPERLRSLIAALPDLDPGRRRPLRRPGGGNSLADLVAPGPRPSRYNSDSEAVQALATAYANRGRSFPEFAAALADAHPNSPVGRAYRRRGEERGRWARRSWAAAERFVRARPARGASASGEHDDRDVLKAWELALPAVRLPKSARRAAEALQRLAVEHGRALVGLSVRALAERSGVSAATASTALRALRGAGLIELAGAALAGRAHR